MEAIYNKILLIEDNVENLENFSEILELEGYEVIPCNNGEHGISMIQSVHPNLIISDVQLPGINGFEIIRALKNNTATEAIPFMFLSASSERKIFQKGMSLGALKFLIKPCPIETILDSIREIISQEHD